MSLYTPLLSEPDSHFSVSKSELREVFGPSADEALQRLGGITGLAAKLQTSLSSGIDLDSVPLRKTTYFSLSFGSNAAKPRQLPPFLGLFWAALRDPLLLVLLFAAVVSGFVSLFAHTGMEEGIAVFTVAVCIALTTAATDYLQIREFHNTIGQIELANCTVVRTQLETEIPVSELVVGDIVRIKTGMSVPADGLLLEAFGLKVDESSMTGESDPVVKRTFEQGGEGSPWLRSGTKVEEGTGSCLVCQVGAASISGQLRALGADSDDHDTPLQAKLKHISNVAAVLGAVAAALVFVVLLVHTIWTAGKRKGWDATSWEELTETLMTVVAILVVAVPEGLPLAVTLTLAYSVGKMKEQKNLVRHLRACETMGAVAEVCTDKTGTLTLNRMQVVGAYFLDTVTINRDDREFNLSDLHLQRLFMESFCLNSDASVVPDGFGGGIHRGNRTDCALLALSLRWKCDYIQMRRKYPVVTRVPFSSQLKWMGTIVRVESGLRVLIKGAAEAILPKCSHVYDASDLVSPLSSKRRVKLNNEVVLPFTSQPLRTILVAYKDVQSVEESTVFDDKFTLLGIFGIEDGIRPEVPAAVQSLQEAQITVRMVTGDSLHTAIAVAQQVGILQETPTRYTVMEGNQFEHEVATADGLHIKDLDDFARVVKELRVLARCSPTQKYLLICGLKALGSVVAVTGDGCNDAPALRQADVGFAMNIVGTEVAKEAADIILLDDNFASIVTAATWGRHTYDSIRRFIQFQLTASVSALVLCVLGSLTLSRSPLAPVQMLWVNLLIDSVAAIALNAEPPEAGVLKRPPHVRGEPLLSANMKKTIVVGVSYQLVILIGVLLLAFDDVDLHFTLVFHTFVLMQLVHEFCCRSLSAKEKNPCGGVWRNPTLLCVVVLSLLGQLCVIHFGG